MPASVGDLNYVTVHGTYETYTGTPISGTISFVPSVVLMDAASDLLLVPRSFTATLDSSGHFSINLAATDDPDITPTGWTYAVTESFVGGRQYNISVPVSSVGASVSLAALAPVVSSVGGQNFVTMPYFNSIIAMLTTETQDATITDNGDGSSSFVINDSDITITDNGDGSSLVTTSGTTTGTTEIDGGGP